MSASFPSCPWERVGVDLFEFRVKIYILIADYYYSSLMKYRKLTSLRSEYTIAVLKGVLYTRDSRPHLF